MHYIRKGIGYMIALFAAAVLLQSIIAGLLVDDKWSVAAYVCVYAVAYIIMGGIVNGLKIKAVIDDKGVALFNLLPVFCACVDAVITGVEWKTVLLLAVFGELSYVFLVLLGHMWKSQSMVVGWTIAVYDSEEGKSSSKKYISEHGRTFMKCGEVNLSEDGARLKLQKLIDMYNPPYVVASVEDEQLRKEVYATCGEMEVMVVECKSD